MQSPRLLSSCDFAVFSGYTADLAFDIHGISAIGSGSDMLKHGSIITIGELKKQRFGK